MKQYYLFTEADIRYSLDFANGERLTVNAEDAEPLPEGGRWLTREDVAATLQETWMIPTLRTWILDELFGKEGVDRCQT